MASSKPYTFWEHSIGPVVPPAKLTSVSPMERA